jgi:hypothetical protein
LAELRNKVQIVENDNTTSSLVGLITSSLIMPFVRLE